MVRVQSCMWKEHCREYDSRFTQQQLSYLTVLPSNEDANYEIQVLEQAEK